MAWERATRPPRAWQAEALPVVLRKVREGRRGVVVACTGAGKSVWMAEVIAELLEGGAGRVVVTTPTRKLVAQLGATLRERLGDELVGLYYTSAKEADRRVVVACNASARALAAVLGGGVDLWVPDECHETEADGMLEAAEALAPRAIVGLTATPFRSSDWERLSCFDEVFYRFTLVDAVRAGVVVPWRVVPWVGGRSRDVRDVAVEMIRRHVPEGEVGFINSSSIAEAEALAEHLSAVGIAARAVHSRLPEEEQEARMVALREQTIRAVVYVDSLYRGIDEPHASWLLMLRDVKSRVRFIQEFGRVLRTHPGKEEAIILDPHGLAERFDLLTSEALGRGDEGEERGSSGGGEAGEGEPEAWSPWDLTPLDALSHWTAQLVQAAQADGLLPLRFRLASGARARTASPAQVKALRAALPGAKYLPDGHRTLAAQMCSGGHAPSAGACSDLLDVLHALADSRRAWKPRLHVWLPELGDLDLASIMDAGEVSAAGVVWQGWRSVAVVHGRRTLVLDVRRAVDGQTSAGAAVEAILRAAELRPREVIRVDDRVAMQAVRGELRPSSDVAAVLSGASVRELQLVLVERTEARKVAFGGAAGRTSAEGRRR